jgi:hypothetical protein
LSRGALSATAAITLIAAVLLTGCSSHGEAAATSASPVPSQTIQSGASSGPEAKVHINYGSERDYLSSLTVTKYPAAYTLDTARGGQDANASIFRFDGGVPVWQIQVDTSVLSDLPGLGKKSEYRLSEVQYGVVPKHFVQSTPDLGSPEPLEANHYYIFSVMRASGSTDYEAIKVEADGSLEGYNAEPRAGTSFRLCCNVNADFPGTAPAPPPPPSDSNGPNSNGPDSNSP